MTMTKLYCWSKNGVLWTWRGVLKKSGQIKPQNQGHNSRIAFTIKRIGATLLHREARLQSAQIPPQAHQLEKKTRQVAASTIAPLGAVYTTLDIPAGWMLLVKRNHLDGNKVAVQYAFTWAVQLCTTSKQAFTIYEIGHKFETAHGFARSRWFRRCAIDAQKHHRRLGNLGNSVRTSEAVVQLQPTDDQSGMNRRGLHAKRRGDKMWKKMLWGSWKNFC